MKKRILSLLLALLMVVSTLPLPTYAEDATDYSDDKGKYVKLNEAVTAFSVYNQDTGHTFTYYHEDFQTNTVLRIEDWKVEGKSLWYRVTFYKGGTQGDYVSDFPAEPWILQNDGSSDNALVFVTPCVCCENCTGAEDCQCQCGACDFCQPEEPELPTLTHPTGVEVTAESFPEGVTLEVDPDADVSAQFTDFGIPAAKQVFGLDISLVNADSSEYQPGGAIVKVPVDETIPVGTMIGIIHKHGDKVATFIGLTEVLSDHTVEFYTDSFSEFAGFTVDFHYNGVDFSIDGRTSILLSHLFVELNIPEDATAASAVVFSDNALVDVEKQSNGDWLLTSLDAFDTEETLVINFTDGRTIVIDVTDEKQVGDYWEGLEHHKSFQIFDGVNFDLTLTYNIFGDIAANYHLKFKLVNMSQNGTKGNEIASDKATHEHYLPNIVGHSFSSSTYWFYVADQWAEGSWILGGAPEIYVDNHSSDSTLTMGCSWLGGSGREAGVHVYAIPLTIPLETAADNVCDISQRSQVSENRETRTVNVYVDGVYKGKQSGSVYFPSGDYRGIESGNGTNTGDLRVTPASGYFRRGDVGGSTTVVASGTTYDVYLVTRGTIQYDANGGSGAPAAQYKYHGVNLTLQSGQPTKAYSTFKGWATSKERADEGTVDYKAGGTYSGNLTSGSTTTLFAVWEYNDVNYTVKHFQQNLAGTGYDEVTADRQTLTAKAYASVKPAVKTYPGFTSPNTKTVTVSGDGSTVVEYKYDRLSYTINYLPGIGSGSMTSQTFKYSADVTIKSSTFTAPKGQKFLGWTTNTSYADDGHGWTGWSGTWSYVDGQYGINNRTLNLYARWGKKTFTVNYHSNGGSGSMTSDQVVYNTAFKIKDNTFTPPTGKKFVGWGLSATGEAHEGGWSNKADGTGYSGTWTFDNGEKGIANETLNLYAIWEDAEYTVTWKNWNGDVLETDTVVHNGGATYDGATPTKPDANGYSYGFSGWDKSTANVTDNMVVTAQFTATAIPYTATFDYNGGNTGETTKNFTVATGLTLPALTRTGYTGKWKVTTAAGNWVDGAEYASEGSVTDGKYGNVTFTAQWTAQYRYVLKFDANGGSGGPADQTRNWCGDTSYTFGWDQNSVPTREGYSFLGWAESSTSQTNVAGNGYNSYQITGKQTETVEKTLYAVWKRDTGNLKLTFNGGDTAPAIVTVAGQGKTITLVLTKSETVIRDLPTGTYNVTVESGNASYTASVDPDSDSAPTIEKNQTAEVEITIQSKGLNWFTAFYWVKNQFKKS